MGMTLNKTLKSNKGFSLTEIVVALAVSGIVVMMAGKGLLDITRASVVAQDTAEKWNEEQSLAFSLNSYLGRALRVNWTTSPITNIGNNPGLLRDFNSGFVNSNTNSQYITLGAFLREAGAPDPANPTSDIRATGLYFKNPSIQQSGQLVISSSSPGFGPVTISSHDPDVVYDSIVELEIKPGSSLSNSGAPVRMAHVRVVTRRFLTTIKTQWHYCPASQLGNAACQTGARYVDTTQHLFIPMANNAITNGFGQGESLYGDIYFFQVGEGS